MNGVIKWIAGTLAAGIVVYLALPLLGIDPDTKRFYGADEFDHAEDEKRREGREAATRRAKEGRPSQ